MRTISRVAVLSTLLAVLAAPSAARAGVWIRPQTERKKPSFPEAMVFGRRVSTCPRVYRTVIDVPAGCDRATVMIRTADWACAWVDGRQVLAAGVNALDGQPRTQRVARNRLHWLDLSEQLTPGRHVLAVSASERGFVADGGLYAGVRRLADVTTSADWTVTVFAPATVIEDQPVVNDGYDGLPAPGVCGAAESVRALDDWTVREDTLARVHFEKTLHRYGRKLADLRWRLDLMAEKGLYFAGDVACGWGGPARLGDDAAAEARKRIDELDALGEQVQDLAGRPIADAAGLQAELPALRRLEGAVGRIDRWLADASEAQHAADEAVAATLAARVLGAPPEPADTPAPLLKRCLAERIGFPLNELNSSRHDRLGWLPLEELADSDVRRWGVRIRPVLEPGEASAERAWWFRTDADDVGIERGWANITGRGSDAWRAVRTPDNWAKADDATLAGYRGPAWYRGAISVPAHWAGLPVRVEMTVAGSERLWINGREVTDFGGGRRKRSYVLPPEAVVYGGPNMLTVRVKGEGVSRGLLSGPVATCPSLAAWAGRETPPVDVLATPLSPCVVLTPRTRRLHIRHGGTAAMALPAGGDVRPCRRYDAADERRLDANWALLWLKPATSADVRRPILLVFEANPAAIRCTAGLTEIELDRPGRRIIAVRPWARRRLKTAADRADLLERVNLWSRAALAVPVNYMNITRIQDAGDPIGDAKAEPWGPVLEQTTIYDYLRTTDAWGTKPLRMAPLPALAGYALDNGFRSLAVDQADRLRRVHDGGVTGRYRVLLDSDRVRYAYRIEPYPRTVGVTADCGGSDAERGPDLVSRVGANSMRIRHAMNAPSPVDRGDGVVGLACVHALEAGYGGEAGSRDGRARVETLAGSIESLARQAADRPFEQVRFDLVGVPGDAAGAIAERLRAVDSRHLLYIEPGGAADLAAVTPMVDSRTVYGFSDRGLLRRRPVDHWPGKAGDRRTLCRRWWPAIAFSIRHQTPLHCAVMGESVRDANASPDAARWLNDAFALFDQFGMHSHAGEAAGLYRVQVDGSLQPTPIAKAYRTYSSETGYNVCYRAVADQNHRLTADDLP